MPEHKFKREKLELKRDARDELELPHDEPKNVPELRERLYHVELYLGLALTVED